MMRLMAESPITAMGNAMDLVGLCALLVVLGVIPMVGFDVFFQIFSHLKKLRMSRQDIRDEFKQSEGDPHVKGRIRQMQRAAARRRMMADVPKADVIVNNPTHYSVALQYDENKMSAPKVVAKGAGLVALRIREVALKITSRRLKRRRWRERCIDMRRLVNKSRVNCTPRWRKCWPGSGN